MANTERKVRQALDAALAKAMKMFHADQADAHGLSDTLATALDVLNARAQTASAVFTNIVTCLAIKASHPDIDVRYHQVQIQNQTDRPAGFNFRASAKMPSIRG